MPKERALETRKGDSMAQERNKSRTRYILAVAMLVVTTSVIAEIRQPKRRPTMSSRNSGKPVSVSREMTTPWTESCFVRRLKAGSPWWCSTTALVAKGAERDTSEAGRPHRRESSRVRATWPIRSTGSATENPTATGVMPTTPMPLRQVEVASTRTTRRKKSRAASAARHRVLGQGRVCGPGTNACGRTVRRGLGGVGPDRGTATPRPCPV